MPTTKTTEWVNIATSIGVLVGLILVAYELRQNNEIAEAETFRTMWEMVGEINRLGVETDIMTIYRSSLEDPAALSDDDVDRLSAFLTLALEIQVVKAVMRDSYGLYPISVEEQASDISGAFLAGSFGRAWFEANESWISVYTPELSGSIRDQLAELPLQKSSPYGAGLRDRAVRINKGE